MAYHGDEFSTATLDAVPKAPPSSGQQRLVASKKTSSSTNLSRASLQTDSTGYGSFPRRTPTSEDDDVAAGDQSAFEADDDEDQSASGDVYYSIAGGGADSSVRSYSVDDPTGASVVGVCSSDQRSDKGAHRLCRRRSKRLKSAASEAAIDSYFVKKPQFYDLRPVALSKEEEPDDQGCYSDEERTHEILDQVEPTTDLTLRGITDLASAISGLIADMRCASQETLDCRPPPAASHIYEEIQDDSTRLYDLAPCVFHAPPLPGRNPRRRHRSTLTPQAHPGVTSVFLLNGGPPSGSVTASSSRLCAPAVDICASNAGDLCDAASPVMDGDRDSNDSRLVFTAYRPRGSRQNKKKRSLSSHEVRISGESAPTFCALSDRNRNVPILSWRQKVRVSVRRLIGRQHRIK